MYKADCHVAPGTSQRFAPRNDVLRLQLSPFVKRSIELLLYKSPPAGATMFNRITIAGYTKIYFMVFNLRIWSK
ncbi:MAG TPA: hypothetical protein VK787_11360 [Puia sp.]|nr:hypothetical protein [Puia sp.]